ncbi:MAG: hypothetical protein ANABAC_2162 [Anaerolineae bacterium]|jgi:ABC-type microcin C transport system permease subunit YejE|nr:MAG: hypothetical protein ANABAC_2162 [Anaerolineae bacterium]
MTNNPSSLSRPATGRRHIILTFLVIPLISCMLSSCVGILIGQVGNLFYLLAGKAARWLAVPGFIFLFLLSFAISFVSSQLLRKWLLRVGR